jgi:hypothetical protein
MEAGHDTRSMGTSGSWDGGTVPYKTIFCGDIPLHRPFIGLIYGRYLQFRFLRWPVTRCQMVFWLIVFNPSQKYENSSNRIVIQSFEGHLKPSATNRIQSPPSTLWETDIAMENHHFNFNS